MKFTLNWLKDHLETDASLDEIATTLTMIGLEVEDITDPAAELAPFTVAHVISAEPHPNADKLRVCVVDTGTEQVQVVCGAPNAHAGMKGVFAPSGTTIPSNGMKLKPVTIRGVESNGMLCSEREMGISDEHTGIIELDTDAPPGTPFAQVLGLDDPVIEIAITPNRPDCLGVHGIARDLAAAGLGTLKKADIPAVAGRFDSPVGIRLEFGDANAAACPAFAGRMVRGVRNGDSPAWLQRRLRAIGLRPINALVDITNYITYDRGRPLHVYDADKLEGNICARMGRAGEKVAALDGKTYDIDEQMCVIADEKKVLGLGGIMGGEGTGCTETTTTVVIESALFDPVLTATTGRRLNIHSDARYRFERGVDPDFMQPGLDMATHMVLDLCGGEASHGMVAGKAPETSRIITFNSSEVERLTGADLPDAEIRVILRRLGFWVTGNGNELKVAVPGWRPDVTQSACLVEEVIRIAGMDRMRVEPLPRLHAVTRPVLTPMQKRHRMARRAMAGRGMIEAVTWSFIPREQAKLFGGGQDALELVNPISSEMSSMRPGLLPGLIAAARRNADRGLADVALFEVGQAYRGEAPEDQFMVAAGIRRGSARLLGHGRHWSGSAAPVDVFEAKADALAVLEAAGAPVTSVQIAAEAPDFYHPGRSGIMRLGPQNTLARFGEVHPRILEKMGAAAPMVAFEVFLDAIPSPRRSTRSRSALDASDLQAVRRDFAFVVDDKVRAGDLVRAARGADKALIADVVLFDVFTGGSLAEGKKSLAIEVTLQPQHSTLTEADIEAVAQKIITKVGKATGGVLRG